MTQIKKRGRTPSVADRIRNIDRKIKRRQDSRAGWSISQDSGFDQSAASEAIAVLDQEITELFDELDRLRAERNLSHAIRGPQPR